MGFKSFLKSVGTGAAKYATPALAGATAVSPALSQNDVFQTINAIVVTAETTASVFAGDKSTGPEKLQAALPLVVATLKSTPLVQNHRIADEQKFEEGAQSILNGVVAIMNSLAAEEAKTARKAAG